MANPYQQQVFQRKLVYIGIMIALLIVAGLFRFNYVEAKANELGRLEETKGEVDALGSTARVALIGFRGFATTVLWQQFAEEKRKNKWSEMERTVRQITRLQPHLVAPLLHLGWNISYNVVAEVDRPSDKYFWVTRGIQLLAEGERQNLYQPEIRREIGFSTQHKICTSDENNLFRSFFQLSCIPPQERRPERFRSTTTIVDEKSGQQIKKDTINYEELEQFCIKHPQLARRLHQPPLPYDLRREHPKFRCKSAQELLLFLEENQNIPSLYVTRLEDEQLWEKGQLKKNPLARFPVLPPRRDRKYFEKDDDEFSLTQKTPIPDEFDAHIVSRIWYGYSQECLPEPHELIPGEYKRIEDPKRQRVPRNMNLILFRNGPARAQTFVAERLQEEGWFDAEPYAISKWFQRTPTAPDRPVLVGEGRDWSREAWNLSGEMWQRYADENNLEKSARFLQEKKQLTEKLREIDRRDIDFANLDPEDLDPELRESLLAQFFVMAYEYGRNNSNYVHFRMRSRVEAKRETFTARKFFYNAEQDRLARGEPNAAFAKYQDPRALLAWRKVLEDEEEFRKDANIQEQTFEIDLKYIRLYRRLNESNLGPDLALLNCLGHALASPPGGMSWTSLSIFGKPELQPELTVIGPLDVDRNLRRFIDDEIRFSVLQRRGLIKDLPRPNVPPPSRPSQMPR